MMRNLCLLLLLLAGSTAFAAGGTAAIDRPAATAWLAEFNAALQRHDSARLSAMIDAGAAITVQLLDGDEAPLQLTLTREEYLQQARALWRFATGTAYDNSNVGYAADAGGDLVISLDQDSRWKLFGTDTGQQSRLLIRLARRDGVARAIDIRATTRPW